jgi:heptosyltransferase II
LNNLNNTNSKPIQALIELPTWLGDTVMSAPAIENIISNYNHIEITIIGTFSSIQIFKEHPSVVNSVVIDSKIQSLYISHTKLGFFDVFFTFRGSFRAKLLKFNVKANKKYQFNYKNYPNRHQVEKYVDFINHSLSCNYPAGNLINHFDTIKQKNASKLLGINPGATYGASKRWYPEQFAKVAIALSNNFDIIIFGSQDEQSFAKKIEHYLTKNNINNYLNLAGKTSIAELNQHISSLDIFLTGDSGPMHIAASLQIPTIAIFGPTNSIETSQWKNEKAVVIKKNLDCQPCMKRVCPLKHHNCMKLIDASDVINAIPLLTN